MSSSRSAQAGATRICPHCKATILQSASVCPACRHYLRFDSNPSGGAGPEAFATTTALQVEGSIRHPEGAAAWEYTVVVTVRDEFGDEVARHVVGVGAMYPGDQRSFNLSVEVAATNERRRSRRSGPNQ